MRDCEDPTIDELTNLIEPSLTEMGFELVQIRMMGGSKRTLQVMAEPTDRERQMTVDDCADISRTVSAILDVADPIVGNYTLEVSSPGIDRPLVKSEDFERFAGFEAKIELTELFDGRRRLTGKLLGLAENEFVSIEVENSAMKVPFHSIRRAKLTLSDELIAAHSARH